MAQVRAALRSYAAEGGSPGRAVEQLATFVELFSASAVVTVIYGILDRPGPDGSRRFSWANAGHLPPLFRRPDGRVEELVDAISPLLGAPSNQPRPTGDRTLDLNSTLLFYTDGLVETEGADLAVTVGQLRDAFAGTHRPTAEGVCAAVLDTQLPGARRDDVALLVVTVTSLRPQAEPAAETAGTAQ
jgi:serine phosphatase RsbU (regulator of sigma subunit)